MFVTDAEDALIFVKVFQNLFDYIDESKSGELDTVSSDKFKDVVDACTM